MIEIPDDYLTRNNCTWISPLLLETDLENFDSFKSSRNLRIIRTKNSLKRVRFRIRMRIKIYIFDSNKLAFTL